MNTGPPLITLLLAPIVALAQKPVVSLVVNAASYQLVDATLPAPLSTGLELSSIGTIFGTNLAASTASAASTPLPTKLAGTSVTYAGMPAPLLYVSSKQINFQVPLFKGGLQNLVVTTASGASDPFPVSPFYGSPLGIFTRDSSGCGQGAVLNDNPDGSVSINSPSGSVSPGDYISIFGTGLFIQNPPPAGSASPSGPLAPSSGVGTLFDLTVGAGSSDADWSGLAPGLVGVGQVNVQVPANVREGCAVPLQIVAPISQPVTVAIRNGGGSCVDPPAAGYGQILWQKTVVTTAETSTESDALTVSLQASPGKQAPQRTVYTNVGSVTNQQIMYGPSCPIPGYRSLGAGAVTAQAGALGPLPATVVPLQQGQVSDLSVYQAALPAGAVQQGQFTVNAAGGPDLGAFQSSLKIGSGIQITTPIAGVDFDPQQPITINWVGGDPNAWVTFKLVNHQPGGDGAWVVQARASAGSITLPTTDNVSMNGNQVELLPGPYTADMEIDIEVTPDPSEIVTFSASGLSLGGQHTWSYLYRFLGVTIGGS